MEDHDDRRATTEAPTDSVLLALHARTHQRRADRRGHDWKITIAVWAALLLATPLVIGSPPVQELVAAQVGVRWAITAAIGLVVVLYLAYVLGLQGAMTHDRNLALQYEAGLHAPTATKRVTEDGETIWTLGPWFGLLAAALQVGMTAVLALAVVLVTWSATSPACSNERVEQSSSDGSIVVTVTARCPAGVDAPTPAAP